MPTYDYRCSECRSDHEEFHGINDKPRVKCPLCGGSCRKLISGGAGVIFKGKGFYETDYKARAAMDKFAEDNPNSPSPDQE